jgi:hypothetical protein
MADKQKLAKLMEQRATLRRETVQPVNRYAPANESAAADSKQASKAEKKKTSKPAKKPTRAEPKKFASYLRPESIKALKRIAVDTDRNDYEVLQEAVDAYVSKREGKA